MHYAVVRRRVLRWYMLAEVDTLCNPIKIGLWKGPHIRSKCVVTMNPTQAGQSGVVGTRSAPPGLIEDIRSGSRQIGPRQIGPRQIGPLENLAANWAPANRALFGAQFAIFWQIGPRQIGPLGGKLGPGKSGPGRLGPLAANWAPEI